MSKILLAAAAVVMEPPGPMLLVMMGHRRASTHRQQCRQQGMQPSVQQGQRQVQGNRDGSNTQRLLAAACLLVQQPGGVLSCHQHPTTSPAKPPGSTSTTASTGQGCMLRHPAGLAGLHQAQGVVTAAAVLPCRRLS